MASSDAKAQSNLTRRTADHEDEQRRVAVLQRQVAVDGAHQLVVATEVTANASDQGGVPALRRVEHGDGAGGRRLQQRAGLGGPSTGMCPWAGRGRRPGPATRRSIPRRVAWPRSCRGRRAVRRMQNASGCRRLPTAGSSTCWDSDASACGGGEGGLGLGVPGVEHQAPARPDGGV